MNGIVHQPNEARQAETLEGRRRIAHELARFVSHLRTSGHLADADAVEKISGALVQ